MEKAFIDLFILYYHHCINETCKYYSEAEEYYCWSEFRQMYGDIFFPCMRFLGMVAVREKNDSLKKIVEVEVERYNQLFAPNHPTSIDLFIYEVTGPKE